VRAFDVEILNNEDEYFTDDIKKIYDFGRTEIISDGYNEPEYILALDYDDNICLLRG
jgi:hypothetical protein